MDLDQLEIFINFVLVCAKFGFLGLDSLDDEQQICLFEECLVWAVFLSDRVAQGRVYLSLGHLFRGKKQLENAIQCYRNFLRVIDAKEATVVVYMILGNIYYSLKKHQEAIECFNSVLNIAVEFGDKNNERFAIHNLGGAYFGLERHEEALKYYEKSLKIAIDQRDKRWEMEAYENLGAVCLFSSLSRYDDAIDYCEKCLSIATEINDKVFEERAYRNLGIACQKSGKHEDSVNYCKKHLEIARSSGDKEGQKRDYYLLGETSSAQGKHQDAVSYYEQYLGISIETENIEGEADACIKLAIVCRSLGRYNDAIKYHEKAIAIVRRLGNTEAEGIATGSLGHTYVSLGEYQEAIKCAQKSLTIAKDIGSREGERNALGLLGNIYHKLREFLKGIEYHKQCLEIDVEIGDKKGEGKTYGNLGLGYQSLRENDKAIEYHEKNLKTVLETGDRQGQMVCYGNLGNGYRLVGMYQESIDSTLKSLELAKELGDRDGQGGACFLLAHCYYVLSYKYATNKWDGKDRVALLNESEKYLKESIECYEWIFDHLEHQDQFKISIVDTFSFAYQLLTTVFLETQRNKDALLTSERGRARALSDLLTTKYKVETEPQNKVLNYSDVEDILTTPNACILFFGILMQLDKNIESYVTEGGVATWIMTVDSAPFVTLYSDMQEDEIEEIESSSQKPADDHINNLVNQAFSELNVREAVVGCEDRSLDASPDVRCIEDVLEYNDDPLETLFEVLIGPIQDRLTQKVVVIPDGRLFVVPYAALRDPKTKTYLSENKRIRLAPSLTTLKILKESLEDHHSMTGALIVGDPEVGKVMFQNKEKHFSRLPGAKREAEAIAEMLGVDAITGPQATKQAIKQRLREGVAVVHFAAHGSTEGEIALTSSASTGEGSIPQEEDYLLTMKEVQEIGIRAQLVVLSCCHSGRGEIKAEGVVGMSRAFLAAGARAVVGSLWAIADQATRVFMGRFYEHLKQEESASTSLHKAMQHMRDSHEYSEPRFWAPFFLIGDDVTISL